MNDSRNKNIYMVRGDTLAFGMEFVDLEQDLDSAYFSVASDPDSAVLFQKSIGDGIEKVETGKYRVRVAPEDTANLAAGTYYYDLQVTVNSDVQTILIGSLRLDAGVTR